MATLVNGNGNPAVYAQQDADLYVGVMGTTSCIMSVGSKFAATIETANLISVADGVILTKEGRRIQTDVGEVDEFNIPNGAAGVTRYYIIGYHLYTDGQGSQKCETFVQLMSSATDTIPEAEFRNGATEVYVSLYRVTQVGLTLNNPESLLPDALNLGDINASLTEKVSGFSDTTYSAVTGLAYDATNKKLGLKVGADTVIPFSGMSHMSIFAGGNYSSVNYAIATVNIVDGFIQGTSDSGYPYAQWGGNMTGELDFFTFSTGSSALPTITLTQDCHVKYKFYDSSRNLLGSGDTDYTSGTTIDLYISGTRTTFFEVMAY